MFVWTPENVNILRERKEAGASASEIGQELGVSRSAVLGKCGRLGLSSGRPGKAARTPTVVKQRMMQERAVADRIGDNRVKNIAIARARAMGNIPAYDPVEVQDSGETVPLLELKSWSCRWPIDTVRGTEFCGKHRSDHLSYCAGHAQIAYRPVGSYDA